jgi:hypothetical protein
LLFINKKYMKKKIALIVLSLSVLLSVAGAQAATTNKAAAAKVVAPKFNSKADVAAKNAALKFVKENLVDANTKVGITITKKVGNLYILEVALGEGSTLRKVETAITADGKYFFPQLMDVDKIAKDKKSADAKAKTAAAATVVPQTDKPKVELFVMSHCPYGTQIEKGIIPVVEALGSNIDFQLKFVNYTMHGDKENTEEVNQYCINKEEPTKFFSYLKCFLEAGDSAACLTKASIDQTKLKTCAEATAKNFKVSGTDFSIYEAENTKYGVQGSPTLIINGVEPNSSRDSAGLAKNICAAFTKGKQPAACANNFSNATPAPGFGTGTSGTASSASCGS